MKLSCLAAVCGLALATSASAIDVHTHHYIRTNGGHWNGMLSFTSPNEAGYFTDKSDRKLPLQPTFTLDPSSPYYFGFGFSVPGTDFDVSYVVTIVKKSQSLHQVAGPMFASPTCQFNVSASSPGHPDVRISTYNGAKCQYLDNGQGGDFQVS